MSVFFRGSKGFFLGDQLKSAFQLTDKQKLIDGLDVLLKLAKRNINLIPNLVSFIKMIEKRMDDIVSGTIFHISNGPLEGVNNMIKILRRQSYGFRDQDYFFFKIWDVSRRCIKHKSIHLIHGKSA